jgi:hypothetical protein
MTHSFSSHVSVAPDVLFRIVGDEAVLLNLKTELYLGLDPVGTRMWTVLTNASSIQDAYMTLLEEYDVDPERLRSDLSDFVGKLWLQTLITIDPQGTSAKAQELADSTVSR